jgi:hypothetical protein
MTDRRFNQLINGPLGHPLMPLRMTRLILALKHVVQATGDDGERALEDFCRWREVRDRQHWDQDMQDTGDTDASEG